jgi:hypothetical protein
MSSKIQRTVQSGGIPGAQYASRPGPATDTINSIKDINTHCLAEFRKHWECLDDRNHQLWQCRPAEWKLNKCVYDNLVRQPWSITLDEGSNTTHRNSRRRSPISQRTLPLFTFDQSRSLPMYASGLETASHSFRGRRMRNNKALEFIKIEARSCIFVDESKRELPAIKSKSVCSHAVSYIIDY